MAGNRRRPFPLKLGPEMIENVKEFPYLGSVVVSTSRVDVGIEELRRHLRLLEP